jgi:hypothetical protein
MTRTRYRRGLRRLAPAGAIGAVLLTAAAVPASADTAAASTGSVTIELATSHGAFGDRLLEPGGPEAMERYEIRVARPASVSVYLDDLRPTATTAASLSTLQARWSVAVGEDACSEDRLPTTWTGDLPLATGSGADLPRLQPDEVACVEFAAWLPRDAGNEVQGIGVTFDVVAVAGGRLTQALDRTLRRDLLSGVPDVAPTAGTRGTTPTSTPTGGASGHELPVTGSSARSVLQLAAALLAAGGVLLALTAFRRNVARIHARRSL